MAEPMAIGEVLQSTKTQSLLENSLSGLNKIRNCPICGRTVQPTKVIWFGREREMPNRCQCEMDKYEQDQRNSEQKQKLNRIQDIFRQSNIGPRLLRASFKNFEQLPGTQTALRESVNFVKERRWESHEGLLIYGQPGNGKSHLAAAIYNATVSLEVASILLVVPDFMTQIKSTYRSKSEYSEMDILHWVGQADIVILDDLGAENLTDNAHEAIYKIVNSLYNREKSLIITTNSDIERELPDRIGPRIYDRILEMCRLVENKGWSYRRKIAERRLNG